MTDNSVEMAATGCEQQQLLEGNKASQSIGTERLRQGRNPGATAAAQPLLIRVWWLSLLVLVHVAWGVYPVVARWLQTRPAEPLPAIRLTFYINLVACISLAACVSAPRLAVRSMRKASAARHEQLAPSVDLNLEQGGEDMTSNGTDGSRQPPAQRAPGAPPSRMHAAADIAVLAVSLGVLAAGAVSASRLTSAYWVQLIFTTSPLMTALIGSSITHEAWPPRLLETLALTMFGAALVVAGGLRSTSYTMTWSDPLGMLVAFAATVGISVYFVWVSKTAAWLSEDAILYINYFSVFSFAPLASAIFEGGRWSSILHWSALDWAALLYDGAGVYGIAKFLQMLVVRRLGANVYSMFISLRVVSAIAGSYLILGERIGSALEAVGCLVVVFSVSWYLWVQWQQPSAGAVPPRS